MIRRSQEALVRQKIANTWLEVHFRRPVARGRSPLFGPVVKWGDIWTPGADSATTLAVSTPIQIEGQRLPQGTYSIWMIPDSAGAWTIIFNKTAKAFHLNYPGQDQDQLRLRVAPSETTHMESLMWYFPSVDGTDGKLAMQWGTTAITMTIQAPAP
ncbi:MAG TPA: DUF2911 domain-containing protein [Gemmatimonadales bacterium]